MERRPREPAHCVTAAPLHAGGGGDGPRILLEVVGVHAGPDPALGQLVCVGRPTAGWEGRAMIVGGLACGLVPLVLGMVAPGPRARVVRPRSASSSTSTPRASSGLTVAASWAHAAMAGVWVQACIPWCTASSPRSYAWSSSASSVLRSSGPSLAAPDCGVLGGSGVRAARVGPRLASCLLPTLTRHGLQQALLGALVLLSLVMMRLTGQLNLRVAAYLHALGLK